MNFNKFSTKFILAINIILIIIGLLFFHIIDINIKKISRNLINEKIPLVNEAILSKTKYYLHKSDIDSLQIYYYNYAEKDKDVERVDFINIENNTILASSIKEKRGERFENYEKLISKNEVLTNTKNVNNIDKNINYSIIPVFIEVSEYLPEELKGYIIVEINTKNIAKTFKVINNFFTIAIIIAILLIQFFILIFMKNFDEKIQKFQDNFIKGAKGDLSIKMELKYENKINELCFFEIGSFAENFGRKIKCKKIINGEIDSCEKCNQYLKIGKDEIDRLSLWFNVFISNLNNIINTIKSSFSNIMNSTDNLTSTMEEISSVVSNLLETSKKINNVANNLTILSEEMKKNINIGEQDLKEALVIIKEIAYKSKSINNIVNTINDIAFQTNILSINASIESARAGEYGSGFNVVANQVKQLAEMSAENSKNISDLIEKIVVEIKNSNEKIVQISEQYNKITENMNSIYEENKQIYIETEEETKRIAEINSALVNITKSSENINNEMKLVNKIISQFTTNTEKPKYSKYSNKLLLK